MDTSKKGTETVYPNWYCCNPQDAAADMTEAL